MNIVFMLLCFAATKAELIDYTRDNYVLIEVGDAFLYENTSIVLHITNLSYIQHFVYSTRKQLDRSHKDTTNWFSTKDRNTKHDNDLDIIQTLLDQLSPTRSKRAIETIGTIWKWIAGSPDHDDKVIIENKINDLIMNNNKQFITNSKIIKALNSLKYNVFDEFISEKSKLLIIELQNIITTLTLSKLGILNPAILNHKEINDIIKKEKTQLVITELIDISNFTIVQNNDIIAIMIKYPLLFTKCKLYETRAISQTDGKLIIDKEIAKCQSSYTNVEKCKFETTFNYCKLKPTNTCLSNLLNDKKTNCTKLREKNVKLEVIKDGIILLSGKHTVDNQTINGTYLATFENTTTIDGIIYENQSKKLLNFLKKFNIDDYDIDEYLETINKELQMDNINLMDQIQTEITNSPTISIIGVLLLITIIIMISVHCYRKRIPRIPPLSREETIELQVTEIMTRIHS